MTTAVTAIGGHTRTIANWMQMDRGSRHSLFVTRQRGKLPSPLLQAVASGHGSIWVTHGENPICERAIRLRAAAGDADLVVLHHFGDDVVPTVAFSPEGGPPVVVLNQADHLFWLGSTVADAVINMRDISHQISRERRLIGRNWFIPIPLAKPQSLARDVARRDLAIDPRWVVLLSIGRPEKYKPSARHNFFRAAAALLERNPAAHLFLLGVEPAQAALHSGAALHERLHAVGPVVDPSTYQRAADIYLEGFPFGSQTALLESALAGAAPLLAPDPPLALVVTLDDSISGIVDNPDTEKSWLERAEDLIRNPRHRQELSTSAADLIYQDHCAEGWLRHLAQVYEAAATTRHRPAPLPVVDPASTALDYKLADWQEPMHAAGRTPDHLRARATEVAYVVRQRGDHRGAARLLYESMRNWGPSRRAIGALIKLVPHRMAQVLHVKGAA